MKKYFLSAFAILTSFVLFSFTTINKTSGEYDVVSGNVKFKAGSAGSFVEYWSHGTEKDVTWKDYVRKWTSVAEQEQIAVISQELAELSVEP